MRITFYSTKPFDREFFVRENSNHDHELHFLEEPLDRETVSLAHGSQAVCCFVNDRLDAGVLEKLAQNGIELVALRCAGFNNVDINAAEQHSITVVRVP